MAETDFDLIVIGGGPGGYVAAIRAAQLGLRTCVIEREHLGGICLNWGCIPTKALLRSADLLRLMRRAGEFGLNTGPVEADLPRMVARSRAVAGQLRAGVAHLLRKNKVTVVEGRGRLAGRGRVEVEGKAALSAPHVILATGARPRLLPGLEPDGQRIWTYREALVADVVPRRLLVVGSGAIGIEFASFFNALGSDVTIVEAVGRILPAEDEEISAIARKSFEKQGMTIITSATVGAVRHGAEGVAVTLAAPGESREVVADRVISAVGIVGNVEDLGLERTAAVVENGHVLTDAWGRTAEPGLHAIGDLAGPPWLAHKASHEALVCVEAIAGRQPRPLDLRSIPACTYCHPQVASVGLSEAKAREGGRAVRVGRFPFLANGKAIAQGETEGLVKTVFDAGTGELLGAHMIGAEVTELIQGYTVARSLESTEEELINTVFPHPTLSEVMHEAVLDAYGRVIHTA